MSASWLRIKSSFESKELYFSLIMLVTLAIVVLDYFGISFIITLGILLVLTIILLVFRYPKFGLYLLIFNLPLNRYIPLFGVDGDNFSVSVNEILIFLLLSSLVLNKLFRGRFTFPDSRLNRPIFLLLAFNVLGLLRAFADLSQSDYLKCWLYFFLWVEYFLIYFLILDLVKKKQEVKTILSLMVLSGIITVISALNQQIEGTPLRSMGYISETGEKSYRLISAFGFFSNDYGAYLQIIMSILINVYFYVQRKRRKYILFLMLPTLYTLFFTFSRSATLGIIVMIIFLAFIRKDHGKTIFISSLAVILVSFLILNPVFKRWKTDSFVRKGGKLVLIKNISERFAQWEAGIEEFKEHPLIGKGFHTYHFREVNFESTYGILKYIGHAHNVYLRLAIESGILGLASFIALIYLVYKYGFQLLKYRTNKELELIIYISLSSFSAFLAVAMTESILTVGRVSGPIFTLIGLLVVMTRIEIAQNKKLIHMKTI